MGHVLGGDEVAEAGRHRAEDLAQDGGQRLGDERVIGVVRQQCDVRPGDEHVIRAGDDHRADLVHQHGGDVLADAAEALRRDALVAVFAQEGIEPVRLADDHHIGEHRAEDLRGQVQQILLRQEQQEDLKHVLHDQEDGLVDRVDPIPLVGRDERAAIGEEVAQRGVGQEHAVNDPDVAHVGDVLDKEIHEGIEQHARDGNHGADDAVGPGEEVHQRADLLLVARRQRLVERVCDRDAQLGQREQRQEAGEQAVQSQIVAAERIHEHRARQEAQAHAEHLADEHRAAVLHRTFQAHRIPPLRQFLARFLL